MTSSIEQRGQRCKRPCIFIALGAVFSVPSLALGPVLLEEAERNFPPDYPRVFPRGVLNPTWANDRKFLRKAKKTILRGRPLIISEFLAPPVADALSDQLQGLASKQNDADQDGWPFQRRTEGPFQKVPRSLHLDRARPCSRILDDFVGQRNLRFSFVGHILVGRSRDKHNAWFSGFRQAMQQPAVLAFWQSLTELPEWASEYDASWSWLRQGDYYGLHADDSQMRYLSLTVHLARDWTAKGGGAFVWCGPEGSGEDALVDSPERPHFHKSFNVSRNGTAVVPGFNAAVVFPIFRNSYHAVGPVQRASQGKRFTLQGWYVDPCHFKPPDNMCVKGAMRRLQDWSEKWAASALSTQPPYRAPLPRGRGAEFEL